jgi:hypothetical protein
VTRFAPASRIVSAIPAIFEAAVDQGNENDKQDLRDVGEGRGQAAKSQNGGRDGQYKECDHPTEHGSLLVREQGHPHRM